LFKRYGKIFILKNDKYLKARGGYARFLNLYCASCKHHLALYQKDDPEPLKRLYIDRILALEVPKIKNLLVNLVKKHRNKLFLSKENCPAIRLYQGFIIKKATKSSCIF